MINESFELEYRPGISFHFFVFKVGTVKASFDPNRTSKYTFTVLAIEGNHRTDYHHTILLIMISGAN